MAVILFGLLSSTALNMIVVPVVYERFGHRAWRTKIRSRNEGSKATKERRILRNGPRWPDGSKEPSRIDRRNEFERGTATRASIADPWFRCQALSIAAGT